MNKAIGLEKSSLADVVLESDLVWRFCKYLNDTGGMLGCVACEMQSDDDAYLGTLLPHQCEESYMSLIDYINKCSQEHASAVLAKDKKTYFLILREQLSHIADIELKKRLTRLSECAQQKKEILQQLARSSSSADMQVQLESCRESYWDELFELQIFYYRKNNFFDLLERY